MLANKRIWTGIVVSPWNTLRTTERCTSSVCFMNFRITHCCALHLYVGYCLHELKVLELSSPWMDQPYYFERLKKKPVSQKVIYFLQVYLCLLTIAFQHPSSHVWTRLRSATSGVQIAVREKASCAFHKYYPARESLNSDFLKAQVHHQHFIVLGF